MDHKAASSMTQEEAVRRSIALARAAKAKGNHPFGALLLLDGEVILEAENTVGETHDPTRHAELNLVSAAARSLPAETRARCTLVTSCEPCIMCCGALYWCGFRRVVYSCPHDRLAVHAGPGLLFACAPILEPNSVEVIGPVLAEEGEAVHVGAWGH
eukprot:m.212331 g.212331  ORF g.212331 m.212331 type:complete len:157 (+) comp20082_c0_seq1:81-551(+)